MVKINANSICTECEKLETCLKDKFLVSHCPDYINKPTNKYPCSNCGNPTTPTGRCRTCQICGETTGCG